MDATSPDSADSATHPARPTDPARPSVEELHRQADQALTAVVDSVGADDWGRPTPCEGWTARDLLAHLIGTERDFLDGRGLEIGAAPDLTTDPAGAWHQHRDTIASIVTDPEVLATAYDGYFGPTTVAETWERFYVFDMVVHRWDLATAVGRDERFTEEELDRIEAATAAMGDAIYTEGVCRPGVEAPAGADRQARLLAHMGRLAPSATTR